MIRKILIAFVLLLLLSVVSYVKTVREEAKLDKKVADSQNESSKVMANYEQDIDSLSNLLNEKTIAYSDSLFEKEKVSQQRIDSLVTVIAGQEKTINSLDKDLSSTKQKLAKKQTTKSSSSGKLSKHEQVYRYYKNRYSALPKDLSEYEKKVAVNEIREETAKKYSISLQELQKIRNRYNLNY